jgi:hypothetical protein
MSNSYPRRTTMPGFRWYGRRTNFPGFLYKAAPPAGPRSTRFFPGASTGHLNENAYISGSGVGATSRFARRAKQRKATFQKN